MLPMIDENSENTQPTNISSQEGEEQDLEKTLPTPLKTGQKQDDAGLDETMTTQVGLSAAGSTLGSAGFEDTIPPPGGFQPPLGNSESALEHSMQPESRDSIAVGKGEGSSGNGKSTRSKRWARVLVPILGLLALLLIAAASAFGGYLSGINLRKDAEKTQVAQIAQEQYELGVQDMKTGDFARARQRFEYVIQLNPNYPGVTDKLAAVLLELNTTATPTLVPTPTVTPTPDLRSEQELFDQGKGYLQNSDWTNAIETLLMLRKTDSSFQAVEVDGMLFLALRNRGGDKILKGADLEGGIYDLTLASRFGPLDSEAQGLLNWTTMYITGASFWDIDWEQAIYYFSQVAPQLPYLTDGSGMTANERLRLALFEYGNQLAQDGAACRAGEQYQQSLAIAPDPQVQQAYDLALQACSGPNEPKATKKPKKTPTP